MTDDEMLESWRANPSSPSAEGIAEAQARFARRIALRNLREWAAAAVVGMLFTARALTAREPLVQVGAGLTVASAVFVSVILARRGRTTPSPAPDAPTSEHLAHHAKELTRQAGLLRVAWAWYAAPFVPGLLLMVFGAPVHTVAKAVALAVCGVTFVGIALLNWVTAAKLDRSAAHFTP